MLYKTTVEQRLYKQKQEAIELLKQKGFKEDEDYIAGGIYLQGSQNYNTHHSASDVDSKFIIHPTYKSLLLSQEINFDFTVSKNEKVSVKPLSTYAKLFWKGNLNNLEMLTTDYFITDPVLERIKVALPVDTIIYYTKRVVVDAAIGMMIQKRKSLFKGTETTKDFVEKFGYDNKDACHAYRIYHLLRNLDKPMRLKDAMNINNFSEECKNKYFKLKEGSFSDFEAVGRYIEFLIGEAKRDFQNEKYSNYEGYEECYRFFMDIVFKETKNIHGSKVI